MEINDIKKVYLSPLMKEQGFKTYGGGWVRELEDGVFAIKIQKGRYNSKQNASWGLGFNAIPRAKFDEMKKNKTQLYMGHVGIRQLMPFGGIFHELVGTNYYFDIHLSITDETPVEVLGEKTVQLFRDYVIPFSNEINKVADFDIALNKIKDKQRPYEDNVISFFVQCRMKAFPRVGNIMEGIKEYKLLGMTKELIEDNMDIFLRLAEEDNGSVSKESMLQYLKILTVSDDKGAFCKEVNKFVEMNKDNPTLALKTISEEDYESFFEPRAEAFVASIRQKLS